MVAYIGLYNGIFQIVVKIEKEGNGKETLIIISSYSIPSLFDDKGSSHCHYYHSIPSLLPYVIILSEFFPYFPSLILPSIHDPRVHFLYRNIQKSEDD